MTPASGRFLLDTSILIALFNGDAGVISHMAREGKNVFIPVMALGELFFGAAKSGRPAENRERVESFASDKTVIAPDFDVAREYGLIKQQLRKKGNRCPRMTSGLLRWPEPAGW